MRPPLALVAGTALLALAPAVSAVTSNDLDGTWHVVIHYRDDASPHPEAMRWDDRVWVFERAGNQLRWKEYPIVVFSDPAGRFEMLGTNRQSRVLHAWEPNPGQLAEIRDGLQVNSRGSKTKTLRGSDAKGWRSTAAPVAASASVITYAENWSIQALPDRPVFAREDFLGAARAMQMEGRTEYRTEQVLDGGALLVGRYERDGTRHGSFRMMRAGSVGPVKGSGKTAGQRVMELFMTQAGLSAVEADALSALLASENREGETPRELREEVRAQVRASIEEHLRSQGLSPEQSRGQIESLTRQIERLLLEEGKSLEEVQRMLREGRITP